MNQDLMEIIKEVAKKYDVKLKKVKDKKDAGIFINVDGKRINVGDIDISDEYIFDDDPSVESK